MIEMKFLECFKTRSDKVLSTTQK